MHYLDYNEKKQHGTPDFPIEYYHVDEHHPRYNMPFHCHKELEIIRILEGILYLKPGISSLLTRGLFMAVCRKIVFMNVLCLISSVFSCTQIPVAFISGSLQSIRLLSRIILQKATVPCIGSSAIFSDPCSIVSLEAN